MSRITKESFNQTSVGQLHKVLAQTWLERTHSDEPYFEVKPAIFPFPPCEYAAYPYKSYDILAILQSLDLLAQLGDMPLRHRKVAVIGGPEAEIFASLGATATGFDPFLSQLPPHHRSNLREISSPLTSKLATAYARHFDITYSSWVFDPGSGVGENFADYMELFQLTLSITASGGISVHNGGYMPTIVQSVPSLRFAIFNKFRRNREDDSDNLYVIHRD